MSKHSQHDKENSHYEHVTQLAIQSMVLCTHCAKLYSSKCASLTVTLIRNNCKVVVVFCSSSIQANHYHIHQTDITHSLAISRLVYSVECSVTYALGFTDGCIVYIASVACTRVMTRWIITITGAVKTTFVSNAGISTFINICPATHDLYEITIHFNLHYTL